MKRLVSIVLPQAVFVPVGFFVGLVCGVIRVAGGWTGVLAQMASDSRGAGPGHAGSGVFVVLAAVVAVLGLAIASAVTLVGLGTGLIGAMHAFVLSSLIDWLRLFRRQLAARDFENVKRWSGRGALAVTAFCAWLLLFNPVLDVAGVFAVTGTFACLGFGTVGALGFLLARLKRA
jgi:hypothetical protein